MLKIPYIANLQIVSPNNHRSILKMAIPLLVILFVTGFLLLLKVNVLKAREESFLKKQF
ncbi:MAG: hypothetical protein V4642_08425 [Bacteroidota bacterium]